MLAATSSPTRASIPDHCSTTSGTRISSTPFDTPSWHRIGLKTSGVDAAGNAGMHDPPGGRGMKTWAPRWSSQQAQYIRYVGFCWPVPCPALWRELLHCSKRRARCRFKSRRWRRNRRAMHSRARSTTRSLRASPKAEVTSSNLERYFARINAAEALRKHETRRNRTLCRILGSDDVPRSHSAVPFDVASRQHR